MTALTITGITFLAARQRDDHPQIEDTLIMFFSAFIALAVSTYLFTDVASEELASSRAAFESFGASMVLAIALELLFLGIAQLMRDRKFGDVARFSASAGKWVGALIIFGFMSVTAINAVGVNMAASEQLLSPTAIGCMVMGGGLALRLLVLSLNSRKGGSQAPWLTPKAWATTSLGVIGLVSVLTAIWAEVSRTTAMPPIGYLLLMVLLFVVTAGYCGHLTQIQLKSVAASESIDGDVASPSSALLAVEPDIE